MPARRSTCSYNLRSSPYPTQTSDSSQYLQNTNAFPYELQQNKGFYKGFRKQFYNLHTIRHTQSFAELEAARGTKSQYQEALITIDIDTKIQSSDGRDLVIFLKGGLQRPFSVDPSPQGYSAIKNLISAYPPKIPTKDQRHLGATGQGGVYHLAFWQQTGHERDPKVKDSITKGATLSREMLSSSYRFEAVVKLFKEMTPVFQACGALFEVIDPENYNRYRALYSKMAEHSALSSIQTTNRACWLGTAILVDVAVEHHRDKRDTMDGWVADTCFGDFSGGELQIPQLGIQVQLRQGDVVFMRSALLEHAVTPFKGERFGMVLFTHQTMQDI